MTFILDSLKEKFGATEKYSEDGGEGFPDMNYIIGNSSAMDVGEVPTPMDERIGYASQIGGEVMELQITNPATFSLEREQMIDIIRQLGIDVTLHSDMNAGYTTAYKSGQQYGYDTVENYFTKYLQELAQFKHEVKRLGEGDQPLFEIGRINPHISTSPMPELSERMAQDVSVDPFGFEINDYDENARKHRSMRAQNIYKNPEFLRKLYHNLFLELSNYPFQQYQTFASYSSVFDKEWRKAQHRAAWKLFDKEAKNLDDKISTVLTANRQDQGIGTSWLNIIEDREVEEGIPRYRIEPTDTQQVNNRPVVTDYEVEKIDELNSLREILNSVGGVPLARLDTTYYQINNLEDNLEGIVENIIEVEGPYSLEAFDNPRSVIQDIVDRVENQIEDIKTNIETELQSALNDLWKGESFDSEDQYISQDAKWGALQNHLEIQNIRIFENAYEIGKNELDKSIEELAADVFSGEKPDKYFDKKDREGLSPEEMHEDMLERIISGQQFEREMWKESVLFYMIIPAWMSSSDTEEKDEEGNIVHKGWNAPEFIWKTLIEDKWDERDDVNIDLTNPRNGTDGPAYFLDLLEDNREFQMDVAAAVGACYAWAHFTQRKVGFNLQGRDFGLNEDEEEEVESDGWTWIEWMNRFGIGVNFETMAGDPQQQFKIWRPKDIAVTAHAINMTARNRLEENGELGGLDHINEELDGRPTKFTIDMEHVATMGVDPLGEMEVFIEQEKDLAENYEDLGIDKAKPIAKILRQMHLMDPGVEGQRGTHHGAFHRGNTLLYEWMYKFVENGFSRNEDEPATILFELAEHKAESSYMMRIAMNLIEIGVNPDELDPANVDPSKDEYEDEREALIARFFGMDKPTYDREWAKIEEHAFDPLDGLLEAEQFDYTWSSQAAIENDNRPQEWMQEEFK